LPKELTHWHIAHSVLTAGSAGTVEAIIRAKPELYYLGAIAYDTAFYDLSLSGKYDISYLGDRLHGAQGENTLTPLLTMLEKARPAGRPAALLSFILGMLTHFLADSTFHPLIFYLTGNYYDLDAQRCSQAVFRHRLLETALDLWLESKEAPEQRDFPRSVAQLSRAAGKEGTQVLNLLADCLASPENSPDNHIQRHFRSAWRKHRIMHIVFQRTLPYRLLSLYRRWGHPEVRKLEALFYRQPINLTYFQNSLTWQHPVSGKKKTTTFGEIYEQSITRACALFKMLDSSPFQEWSNVLTRLEPLSLDSGLASIGVSSMNFFSEEPIEDKLRL
jgi:hypothetical protein